MVQGIGASLSGPAAGVIVGRFGYSAAFPADGAAAALAVFALRMPETAEPETVSLKPIIHAEFRQAITGMEDKRDHGGADAVEDRRHPAEAAKVHVQSTERGYHDEIR